MPKHTASQIGLNRLALLGAAKKTTKADDTITLTREQGESLFHSHQLAHPPKKKEQTIYKQIRDGASRIGPRNISNIDLVREATARRKDLRVKHGAMKEERMIKTGDPYWRLLQTEVRDKGKERAKPKPKPKVPKVPKASPALSDDSGVGSGSPRTYTAGYSAGHALPGGVSANEFNTHDLAMAAANKYKGKVGGITQYQKKGKSVFALRKGKKITAGSPKGEKTYLM